MNQTDLGQSLPIAFLVVIALVALCIAAFFSAIESAFSHLSKAVVDDLVDDGRRNAQTLSALIDHRYRVIMTLRAVRAILQAIAAVATTLALVQPNLPWWVVAVCAVLSVGITQFILIGFLPSHFAARNPDVIALWGTPISRRLVCLSRVFDPLMKLMRSWIPRATHTDAEVRQEIADELREMVDEVGESQGFEDEDREMLRSVFELGNTVVREVMVPRTDMLTIDMASTSREALELFTTSGFSRIPVTGEGIDDVRGILYFKDVVRDIQRHESSTTRFVEHMMRPAEFTVEMKPADDLLRQMQAQHFHLSLVVDEYGGISGLVTLEDLLEEVVGELTDEHDRHVIVPEEIADGVWRVPSRFSIGNLGELLGIDLDDEDVDSVGGLLTKACGSVPLPGATGEALGVYMVAEESRKHPHQVDTILTSLSPIDMSILIPQESAT